MKMGVQGGRATNPRLKIGICGEHGGDPSSVEFCHDLGLDYVSCSPRRIPIARLAAAQAVLKERAAARREAKAGGASAPRPARGASRATARRAQKGAGGATSRRPAKRAAGGARRVKRAGR
jgi:pyruvate,orthophosphate dikinase